MKNDNIFFDIEKIKSLGKNSIIGKTVRIRKPELVSIGNNVIIDDFTYIPCELRVGNYSHIGANSTFIGGPGCVEIGSFVNIAPGCQIVTGSNDYKGGGLVGPSIPTEFSGLAEIQPVKISDFVLIGCQTVILPGVTIPDGVSIGAMSLVKNSNLKPWTLYAGNPLRELGKRDGTLMISQANKLMESEK